jgi:hypothetical protein
MCFVQRATLPVSGSNLYGSVQLYCACHCPPAIRFMICIIALVTMIIVSLITISVVVKIITA